MHASSRSPIFQTCDLMCTFPPFQFIATTNARNRIGIEIRRGFLRLDNTPQGGENKAYTIRKAGVASAGGVFEIEHNTCSKRFLCFPQSIEPDKEPPHERRKPMVSLQPIQQLWTACPCKKICDSLRVGSVRFIGPFNDSVLGSIRSCGGRAALLVTPFFVSCLHALTGILLHRKYMSRALSQRSFGPVRGCSHFLSRVHIKNRPHGWPQKLSDREPPRVRVHRCRLFFFSSFL